MSMTKGVSTAWAWVLGFAPCAGCVGPAPVPATTDAVVDAGEVSTCIHPAVETRCADGWCAIPAGCFVMGAPRDEWGAAARNDVQVQVTLTHSFEIAQHETTQAEWTAVGFDNPSGMLDGGVGDCLEPTCPVGNVYWDEAVVYANRLSERRGLPPCYILEGCVGTVGRGMKCSAWRHPEGSPYLCKGYRLPTEAEWEYAARAGTTSAFYSGDITKYPDIYECSEDKNLDRIGWYCKNSAGLTHPVELKEPNRWGLFDMAGNAPEVLNDYVLGLGYGVGPLVDPIGEVTRKESRTFRGGSARLPAFAARSAYRFMNSPDTRQPGFGFRLARTL